MKASMFAGISAVCLMAATSAAFAEDSITQPKDHKAVCLAAAEQLLSQKAGGAKVSFKASRVEGLQSKASVVCLVVGDKTENVGGQARTESVAFSVIVQPDDGGLRIVAATM